MTQMKRLGKMHLPKRQAAHLKKKDRRTCGREALEGAEEEESLAAEGIEEASSAANPCCVEASTSFRGCWCVSMAEDWGEVDVDVETLAAAAAAAVALFAAAGAVSGVT